MKKKIFAIVVLIIIIISIFTLLYYINNKDKKGFYTLKNDNIKDITSIVGKRNLLNKEYSYKNGLLIKTYKYTNIKNPYSDLSIYINYLKEKSNFIVTKNFDLNKKEGSIQISKYSNNNKYIIILDIKYTKDSYTIKITRGKGKIKVS